MSETAKYRHIVLQYCTGRGIDVGCGTEVVSENAIGVDLPAEKFAEYGWRGQPCAALVEASGDRLPFRSSCLDFVYSSHLLEDYADWKPPLTEWLRILKPGGHLIVIIPDKVLFAAAVAKGQPPNPNHNHEGKVGELTDVVSRLAPVVVLEDRLTSVSTGDYSILFVARKI
jgi:ubiquinone/menaquinone biosynthesis C-methylase UbiE